MSHSVQLARSERRFTVEPGETILSAGLRQGLALPFGCQSGGCGSCRVRLESGHVEYPEPIAGRPPALSEVEIKAGYILMCLARARSDLELDLHQPSELEQLRPRQLTVRVAGHRPLSHDVIELRVKLPQGQPFRFLPGQYVDFLLPTGPGPFESGPRAAVTGIGSAALAPGAAHSRQALHKRRSFSIANADASGLMLEFHLRVTPGGMFAHYVRDQMPERTLLRFEGPLGAFYLREDSARPALLMAGGTGFGPVKSILERQLKSKPSRPLHLFWGARALRDLYLDSLAREWAQQHSNFHYTPVLSEPDAVWDGERGLVHEALLRTYPKLAGYEVYMAGPPAMIHASKQAFGAAGLDADHLFYDSFDYAFETWPGLERKA